MLSILIPIHNFDVRAFVRDLSIQSEHLPTPVEIVCLDDASDPRFIALNQEVSNLPNVTLSLSDKNLGRSGARNRLLELSAGDNLIFLDCDGKVVSDEYLKRYLDTADLDVVYGGRCYQEDRPVEANLNFHWYCGKVREEIPVEKRLEAPYKAFMTNNFMIKRKVYDQVKMDERIEGYGHEDTLFAADLKRKGFMINHIDNPVEHIGIEDVDVFLEKSRNAVKNLAFLISENRVSRNVKLVDYYFKFRSWHVLGMIRRFVLAFEPNIMRNLKSAAPNLLWFDLWKLAHLSEEMNNRH